MEHVLTRHVIVQSFLCSFFVAAVRTIIHSVLFAHVVLSIGIVPIAPAIWAAGFDLYKLNSIIVASSRDLFQIFHIQFQSFLCIGFLFFTHHNTPLLHFSGAFVMSTII